MKKEWFDFLVVEIYNSELPDVIPRDIKDYVVGYDVMSRDQRCFFWATLFKELCRYESGFNPKSTLWEEFNDRKGKPVISTGLFQVSVESLGGYGIKITQKELEDPYKNMSAMVVVADHWLTKDNMIANFVKPWRGMARYWSPFRKDSLKNKMKKVTMKLKAGERAMGSDIYEKFYNAAKKEMGLHEISGSKHNKRILEFHATTTLKAKNDETPWCSSFVNFIVTQCGMKGTNSARAKSWSTWSKALKKPVKGCIVVFTRTGGGHVAFYHSEDKDYIYCLGGNQSNSVNISAYKKDRLLGYRGV